MSDRAILSEQEAMSRRMANDERNIRDVLLRGSAVQTELLIAMCADTWARVADLRDEEMQRHAADNLREAVEAHWHFWGRR